MAKGNYFDMSATIIDPVGETRFQWYISTTENYGGTSIGGEDFAHTLLDGSATSRFTIGEEINPYIVSGSEIEAVYYYSVVRSYNAAGNAIVTSEQSPIIKVVLQDYKDPVLAFLRGTSPIPRNNNDELETGFTPVKVDVYVPETITITVVNTGNIPYLDEYDLRVAVQSEIGGVDLFHTPVNESFTLAVNASYDIHVTSKEGFPLGKHAQRLNVSAENEEYDIDYNESVIVALTVLQYLVNSAIVIKDPVNPYAEGLTGTNIWYEGQPLDLRELTVRLTY